MSKSIREILGSDLLACSDQELWAMALEAIEEDTLGGFAADRPAGVINQADLAVKKLKLTALNKTGLIDRIEETAKALGYNLGTASKNAKAVIGVVACSSIAWGGSDGPSLDASWVEEFGKLQNEYSIDDAIAGDTSHNICKLIDDSDRQGGVLQERDASPADAEIQSQILDLFEELTFSAKVETAKEVRNRADRAKHDNQEISEQALAIGRRLVALRGSRTQDEVRELTGIKKSNQSGYENGTKKIGPTVLARYAKAYNVTTEFIEFGHDKRP